MKSVIFLAFFIAAGASPNRQFDPRSIQEVALWWFTGHSAAAETYPGQPRLRPAVRPPGGGSSTSSYSDY